MALGFGNPTPKTSERSEHLLLVLRVYICIYIYMHIHRGVGAMICMCSYYISAEYMYIKRKLRMLIDSGTGGGFGRKKNLGSTDPIKNYEKSL